MKKIRNLSEGDFLKVFFGFLTAAFLIAALCMPDRAQMGTGLWQILSQPGKISTNDFALGGYAATFLNMGRLSSANSINIGRLAPQITYYFKAYKDLLDRGEVRLGDEVNFCVPTGNFGDILAGYLAKLLGLPVGRLVCASNSNKVLTDFIHTGTYDRRRPLHKTDSPSMDILVSSNLERLLYLMSGQDCALVADLMGQLNTEGFYTVPAALKAAIDEQFWADYASDGATFETVRNVWDSYGYLCDTHTAVGWYAAENYVNQTGDHRPMVVLSTASPYKFPAAVLSAIGGDTSGDEFTQMERLSAITGVAIPANLSGLRELKELHTGVIEKEAMLSYVLGE